MPRKKLTLKQKKARAAARALERVLPLLDDRDMDEWWCTERDLGKSLLARLSTLGGK